MSSKPQHFDAIVAGAGIIGCSIAYHLAERGMRVALLDAQGPAAAASGASDGAISICSKKPGIMARLAMQALRYCEKLASPGGPLSGVFNKRPSFYFSTSEAEDRALDALSDQLGSLDGSVYVRADTAGYSAIPDLGSAIRRVVEVSGEAHMIGYAAVNAFLKNAALERIWPCTLTGFEASGSIVSINTSRGAMTAGKLILATGVTANSLVPILPIIPRSGQLIITDRVGSEHKLPGPLTAASYLLSKGSENPNSGPSPIVIDPLVSGQFLIGSTRENQGTSRQTDFASAARLLSRAAKCYPPIVRRRIIRVFAGVRAAVSDGLPIVGEIPGAPGIIIAAGFEGDGISLSSLVGREIASLVDNGQFITDLATLSPERFCRQAAQ